MKRIKFTKTHLACLLGFLGVLILTVCIWYGGKYYAGLEEIIVTVTSPLKGSDTTAIEQGFTDCAPTVAVNFAVFLLPAVLWHMFKLSDKMQTFAARKSVEINVHKTAQNVFVALGAFVFAASLFYVNGFFGVSEYFAGKFQTTSLYENYYVDPENVEISKEGKGKNLILIYLESMETSYASKEDGGSQDTNYIPNLTQLARDEVNFSENGLLGGYHNTMGSTWTAGSLFSSTAALPYPTGKGAAKNADNFLPNVTSLYDILDQNGYDQYYMCGSDAYFGGRSTYYQTHGNLTIYDHSTAIEDGYIPEDYHVWWGYEDAKLYDIAKDKILKATKSFHPFSFTMITADTHFPQGLICHKCGDGFNTTGETVVSCADCQIQEFIDWCKQQDFYDDTVIVILGDHPRMDKIMPNETAGYERTSYACFVNCSDKNADSTNRVYTQLDLMPTTLGAMGFEIEGDRLGLGTNLFSDQPTLAETMGFENLNNELRKNSQFADDLFGRVNGASMLETVLQTVFGFSIDI